MSDQFDFSGCQAIEGLPGVYVTHPPKSSAFRPLAEIRTSALFTVSVMPGSPSYEDAKRAQGATS